MQAQRVMVLVAVVVVSVAAGSARAGEASPSKRMVKLSVREVRRVRGSPVVLLQTAGARRILPIWIGSSEARVIALRLRHGKAVRPLTLDLLQTTLGALGAKVERVEVDELKNSIFHGKLTVRDATGARYRIDGRPSDLIGIAVGAGIPVWVAPAVLDQAGQPASKWIAPVGGVRGGVPRAPGSSI